MDKAGKIGEGKIRFIQAGDKLILAIVPTLLFIFMLFRLAEIHYFFQGWIDPVYAYLMNGLTFALGSNDIGHTDHPGTPLQLFCALIIRLVGWMRGAGDLATDVLTNPESYLRVISLALSCINCFFLWMLGFFTFKKINNRWLAVAVQLFPLFIFQVVNYLPIPACETVVVFISFAIAAYIILYDGNEKRGLKPVVILALLSALAIATKISSLSILIIPFFFIEKIKTKAIYLTLTFIMIVVFVSPILGKLGNFTAFLGKMATHTGKYGSGEEKLFDMAIYFQSLKLMLTKEYAFTIHLLLIPLGWIAITKQKIQGSLKRLYLAITLASVFQVMVVARHYSFHYLMPVFTLFMPLHGYFWIQYFKEKILIKVSPRMVSAIVLLLIAGVFTRLVVKNDFQEGITNSVEKTTRVIQNDFKGNYIILTENNNDAALMEPALRFGLSYAGATMRKQFTPVLASLYPGNYLWNSHDRFTSWGGSYLAPEVFSVNDEIYLYANTESCEVSMSKIAEMIEVEGMSQFVQLKNVYQNENKGEVIALATVDTLEMMKYHQPKLSVETSMEEIAEGGEQFKSNNDEFTFKGANLQSSQFARSGNKSLLLNASNPYGLDVFIPASTGKRYKIEFWQRSNMQKQALAVATASKSEIFYKTSPQGENNTGQWTLSELNVNLPVNYPETNVHIYLWNPASDSIWIDDFKVSVYQ